jgi:hypothetical protein
MVMKRFLVADFESRLMARVSRLLMIEGEGAGDGGDGGAGAGGAGDSSSLSTAERAFEFWESASPDQKDKGEGDGQGQRSDENGGKGAQDGTEAQEGTEGKDGQEQAGQLTDEQLQADPRFQELSSFRDEIQPLMDQHGIPDSKELGLQLADSKVLYDIMTGKGTPSQLLDVMAQNAGWSKDQVAGVAKDLIGWLTKGGYLKDGQDGGQARGGDGRFKDPLEERLDNFERSQKEQREQEERNRTESAARERQGKIFNTFREEIGKLIEAKGLDKDEVDYYGREIRALIKPEHFQAVVNRIEKGNFVDVKKLFDQVHTREANRLKRWSDKQVSTATRREKTQPRVPVSGAPPIPKDGQQKRDLRTSEGRQAAALEEWDK